MGKVIPLTPKAIQFEIWFRDRLDDQANFVIEKVHSLDRARELAEDGVKKKYGRMGDVHGYDADGNRVYNKVVGFINGKISWVDPWI